MKYNVGFWGVGWCLMVFVGCGKSTASKQSATDGFVEFAQQEIAWLQKTQPGLRKTVSKGEEVSTETIDSVDWANELEWVTAWSLIESAKTLENSSPNFLSALGGSSSTNNSTRRF